MNCYKITKKYMTHSQQQCHTSLEPMKSLFLNLSATIFLEFTNDFIS